MFHMERRSRNMLIIITITIIKCDPKDTELVTHSYKDRQPH